MYGQKVNVSLCIWNYRLLRIHLDMKWNMKQKILKIILKIRRLMIYTLLLIRCTLMWCDGLYGWHNWRCNTYVLTMCSYLYLFWMLTYLLYLYMAPCYMLCFTCVWYYWVLCIFNFRLETSVMDLLPNCVIFDHILISHYISFIRVWNNIE